MQTVNINPNLAWRATEKLSLAAGINILNADLTLERNVNLSWFQLPDASQNFSGDDYGYGFKLGIIYNFADNLSFGASYTSKIDIDLSGNMTYDLPVNSPPPVSSYFTNTNARLSFELPARLHAGVFYKVSDAIHIEGSVNWEEWSRFEKLRLATKDPAGGYSSSFIDKDWNDITSFSFGVKYIVFPDFVLLAGYYKEDSAIPDHTFEPSIPEADKAFYSIGLTKKWKSIETALSYAFGEYEDRIKNNRVGEEFGSTVNGTYEQSINMVALYISVVY
jgi:long-chain fatty acid transport protein